MGTDLRENDVIKSNETPRGEEAIAILAIYKSPFYQNLWDSDLPSSGYHALQITNVREI
ncbi:MAG: hypothetical protein ACJ71R_13385 [Nitrososphaeraceae archaeon]